MKKQILNMLENRRGTYLSGAAIAKDLGVSREAVNKAVTALKQQGFQIDSAIGKGYRLSAACDKISEAGIRSGLCTKTEWEMLILDEVSSTNSVAKQEMRLGKEHLLVTAERQSAGRGRLGKSFYSPQGDGIYMTLGFCPKESVEKTIFLTVATAVAVARALDALFEICTEIKWVNDIYYKGKKLCGILTEAEFEAESGGIRYAVIGIGVNLYVPQEGFPQEIAQKVGALSQFSNKKVLRNQLIAEIVNQLEKVCAKPDAPEVLREYRKRSCVIGKRVTVLQTGKEPWEAQALEIDERARLRLRMENGETLALSAGDVSILPTK